MKKLKDLPVAYFLLTAAVFYAAPAAFFLIMALAVQYSFPRTVLVIFTAVFRIALYFIWGRFVTPLRKPKKPQSRAALYFTALFPLFAKIFAYFFAEAVVLYNDFLALLIGVPILPEIYICKTFGTVKGLVLIGIAYLTAFGAFAAGVKISDRLYGTPRSKARLIPYAVFAVCFGAALMSMGHIIRMRDLSTVSAEMDYGQRGDNIYRTAEGHGFEFEGGWSSVNLRPYYVENPNNKLAKLDEPSDFVISDVDQMPVLNGAEAAYPIYSAFAECCYENIGDIQQQAKEYNGKMMPVRFTNTVAGFEELLTGETDIFFGSKPSEAQYKMAEEKGLELVLTPIGSEGFVFFVNSENPVD
ncbi:MAG: hypothetical protein K2G87_06050, partial [Oscillospiraceae bacterium]|nr:hypothetical protein [Oscillospiraceae bacterium]